LLQRKNEKFQLPSKHLLPHCLTASMIFHYFASKEKSVVPNIRDQQSILHIVRL